MHDVEEKNHTTHAIQQSAFQWFSAEVAMDYPAYTMAICQ